MLTYIKRKNSSEFFTDERCHIIELLNDGASPQMSLARCRVAIGVVTQLHALRDTHETYLIISGRGVMRDGGERKFEVEAGDAIVIDAGQPQCIENIGDTDLIFQVVCRPRFVPECYINLEGDECDG